jgi:predicted RNA-binding protein with PIN domain
VSVTESTPYDEDRALPAALRPRIITIAAQAVGRMPATQLPAALRKSASFAPAKRARLVGSQLAATLETDADFRAHLATQVRASFADLGAAAETESNDDASVDSGRADDVAAYAFLVRPDGWSELVSRAVERLEAEGAGSGKSGGVDSVVVERLETALDQARGETKAVRDKLRAQLDQLKADNAQLRRTLGQTRVHAKEAEERAHEVEVAQAVVRREADAAAREAEAEQRRLRQRIEQLESDNAASRRAARGDRDSEVMRLRLLLDTIMDSAAGLRRELALPPVDMLPADTVPAIDPGAASPALGTGRALLQDDPVLLRQLLDIPRSHLIVDGYNVSKTAWPTQPLDQQRSRLTSGLSALVGGRAVETTIVFDGADLAHPPGVNAPRGIRVRFSPPGVIADDLIRQLVQAEPTGRSVIVVSTDREVAESITKMGARSVASIALIKAMGL